MERGDQRGAVREHVLRPVGEARALARREPIPPSGRAQPGVVPDAAVASLPQEPRLEEAAWNGSLLSRGRFNKAVEDMAGVVVRSLP